MKVDTACALITLDYIISVIIVCGFVEVPRELSPLFSAIGTLATDHCATAQASIRCLERRCECSAYRDCNSGGRMRLMYPLKRIVTMVVSRW